MTKAADYLSRGRRFKGLSDDDARARWVEVFRRYVALPGKNQEFDDISAELGLRVIAITMVVDTRFA